jgi:alpha-aminoadipate carrier protein LysW
MASATCPECEGEVSFGGDVLKGEIAQCPDCGVELEVVSKDPLKVDKAPEEEEDWGE